jgi:hypothetical protein
MFTIVEPGNDFNLLDKQKWSAKKERIRTNNQNKMQQLTKAEEQLMEQLWH